MEKMKALSHATFAEFETDARLCESACLNVCVKNGRDNSCGGIRGVSGCCGITR